MARAMRSRDGLTSPTFISHQNSLLEEDVDWAEKERELGGGYEKLRARARNLLHRTNLVPDLHMQQSGTTLPKNHKEVLEALADGRVSSAVSVVPSKSARHTARVMEDQPERALDILMADLVTLVGWLRTQAPQVASSDKFVRDAVTKRIYVFNAVLPDELQKLTPTALMHLEHEEFGKSYVNKQTMLKLPIAQIPRENFWETEDGFAWKMDELEQALIANNGEMRNPINHRMFSNRDVQAISSHPMTKRLNVSHQTRPDMRTPSSGSMEETINKLEKLANTMILDISPDRLPTWKGLEELLAYLSRLQKPELNATAELQIPGTEYTLVQLVEAALAHKFSLFRTGDLIEEAAEILRQTHL
ncbi:hypothetical protein BGZ60DRAFT_556046 [Tricladium varicosporioides]|nr:hypothetical protein BGZ60DRAFT_556046 [Hymenoscyphus varicosporioides]